MLITIISHAIVFTVGFFVCVWFGPKNKKHYARFRATMEETFNSLGDSAVSVRDKINSTLDDKFGKK